jgi:hypothetical protein
MSAMRGKVCCDRAQGRWRRAYTRRVHRLYQSVLIYSLFQKSRDADNIADRLAILDEEKTEFSRIRCPLCRWQPQRSDLWYCGDRGHPEYFFEGCGTMWNTFTTRGLCPGCRHQWRYTTCLRCKGWSLHEHWYCEGGS